MSYCTCYYLIPKPTSLRPDTKQAARIVQELYAGGFVHGNMRIYGPNNEETVVSEADCLEALDKHWNSGCVVLWSFDAEDGSMPRFPLTRPWYGYEEEGEFYLTINFWHEAAKEEIYADDGRVFPGNGFYVQLDMDNLSPEEGETPVTWMPDLRRELERELSCTFDEVAETS